MPYAPISENQILDFKRTATLRQIEVICVVWELGSITAAAKFLGTSPAGVSRICQRFEDHFDFAIFDKKRKGVTFTAEGEHVLAILRDLHIGIATACGALTGGGR